MVLLIDKAVFCPANEDQVPTVEREKATDEDVFPPKSGEACESKNPEQLGNRIECGQESEKELFSKGFHKIFLPSNHRLANPKVERFCKLPRLPHKIGCCGSVVAPLRVSASFLFRMAQGQGCLVRASLP